jgi:hypothetical protein
VGSWVLGIILFEKGELVEVIVSGETWYGVVYTGIPKGMYLAGEVYEVLINDEIRPVARDNIKKIYGKKKEN